MAGDQPRILSIKRTDGVADQVAFDVAVDYDGITFETTFTGSLHGSPGPIVMLSGDRGQPSQTFVTKPERFGERFNEDWVRAFYRNEQC